MIVFVIIIMCLSIGLVLGMTLGYPWGIMRVPRIQFNLSQGILVFGGLFSLLISLDDSPRKSFFITISFFSFFYAICMRWLVKRFDINLDKYI